MIAKKCDRCGKFYSGYSIKDSEKEPNGFMFLNIDDNQKYFSQNAHDLCPECCKGLIEWYQGGRNDNE